MPVLHSRRSACLISAHRASAARALILLREAGAAPTRADAVLLNPVAGQMDVDFRAGDDQLEAATVLLAEIEQAARRNLKKQKASAIAVGAPLPHTRVVLEGRDLRSTLTSRGDDDLHEVLTRVSEMNLCRFKFCDQLLGLGEFIRWGLEVHVIDERALLVETITGGLLAWGKARVGRSAEVFKLRDPSTPSFVPPDDDATGESGRGEGPEMPPWDSPRPSLPPLPPGAVQHPCDLV